MESNLLRNQSQLRNAATSLLSMLQQLETDDEIQAVKSLTLRLADMIDDVLDDEWTQIPAEDRRSDKPSLN